MTTRPNRFQSTICYDRIAEQIGSTQAAAIMAAAGAVDLPALLPSGPRDLAMLAHELQPFVDVYRALLQQVDSAVALDLIRTIIIETGRTSHSAAQTEQLALEPGQPLVLTSPPPPGYRATPADLAAGFALAMQFFTCEGELLNYTPELVRFRITGCGWCAAMQQAGTPELIPLFCETDERFMDGHPTHKLIRPMAIGLGHACCDFQFVPRHDPE